MRLQNGRLAVCISLGRLILAKSEVPSVDVALQTAFNAPPYLLELLETAADENATSYFPLLDRIADGYFDEARSDEQLYILFRDCLQEDEHLSTPEDLSSFDLALSLHAAAPRIEAHYQYYNTAQKPLLGSEDSVRCENWVHVPFSGHRYCSPDLVKESAQEFGKPSETLHSLPFDRVLGDEDSPRPSVLYGDILSESFRKFHGTVSRTAKEGKTSYRVRYKPSANVEVKPLTVSGYGVELALKRTDYIVIDDRQAVEGEVRESTEYAEGTVAAADASLSEEVVSDLRPLSSSELSRLGLRAASFVLGSDDPFDTLLRLTQDFPKHSSSIAAVNISADFMQEHRGNRDVLLPPGFNVVWINGVQIMARDFDSYSLLEHLRKERKMIKSVRELGFSGQEAIALLSHEAIMESAVRQDVQRYDWRDEHEGGGVIMWLNDLEKDKRYEEWPKSVKALLQRTYPGQLPPVSKDIHNVVMTIDFSSYSDVQTVTDSLAMYVKRKVAIRFGLVPRTKTDDATAQAKLVYYLMDIYGLTVALDYLTRSVKGAGRKYGPPVEKYFDQAIAGRKLRRDRVALDYASVLGDSGLKSQVAAAASYIARLGGGQSTPPILVNGVPIPHTDEWLQGMSQQVGLDSRTVQSAVYMETVSEEDYLPQLFLETAVLNRNPIVAPESDKDIRHLNLGELPGLFDLPSVPRSPDTIGHELVHLTLVADLDTYEGFVQLMEAIVLRTQHDNVEVAVLHAPSGTATRSTFALACTSKQACADYIASLWARADPAWAEGQVPYSSRRDAYKQLWDDEYQAATIVASNKRPPAALISIIASTGLEPGQNAIILNGRVIGPTNASDVLRLDDLEVLLSYERKKRLLPAALAIEGMGLQDKAASPLAFSLISNLIALSQISDVPEGIFDAAPTVRTAAFDDWNSSHTAIKVGDLAAANIQITAAIDPSSELAQRWLPIVKALSELDGVATTIYLNPRELLEELPVKRFYRHVLSSRPSFDGEGSLRTLSARFSGLPADALLNIGMDLPPSWLVAPRESVHDLDNIKLSAVKTGADIDAIYELEHILIEGHSRDVTLGPPPRGAQLVLGTELDPHFSDTIVMANLGYFQFKANPGIYNLALQRGRSEQIFRIDSAGTQGYNVQPGDNTTEIALMSFKGATIFPRLSRRPGMEDEDVLEASKSALDNLADGAGKLFARAGLAPAQTRKYLSKAASLGSAMFAGRAQSTDLSTEAHADINIFSVASGHLYERMLNIMMLSVMKHTGHTVKFWFIEQFLSPSFKTFLPVLAEEYGFKYEMVTYKWPHWLRGQKEKQREIWGYKILFLDVLFPLDLDKVIFVDADQIVRTDMYELVQLDLKGAPYGFTPMCDSRTEMEGFRFWKQGYWKNFLRGLPYHISALYVVDLKKFRQIAAGDRLRQQYHTLSADPASLSNLDQDLPNHMQMVLPIHSLPQEWLWCETWCSDESLKDAKTIDLCNNPQTKEPKLDRARRQVPEWTVYDDEIAAVARRHKEKEAAGRPVAGDAGDAGAQGQDEESIQERLQREDAERERNKGHDEL